MSNQFHAKEYLAELSEELVSKFGYASKATTPGLIGSARENQIRSKLEQVLPSGVGVGTGCVIDYTGQSSRQQDVVLYEKDICPIFSINETDEATYFPCEGVIAVGEIKSSLGKAELLDGFAKIESVRNLKRLTISSKSALHAGLETVCFRSYLNRTTIEGTKEEEFDQCNKPMDQIYGFILCGEYSVSMDTLSKHIQEAVSSIDRSKLPNLVVSLNDEIVRPYNKTTNKLKWSAQDSEGYAHCACHTGNFEYLLTNIYKQVRSGRTVETKVFEHYLMADPDKQELELKGMTTF